MRFRKIKDVLDWTRAFHEALAESYDELGKGHENERVGMLLAYLSAHERTLSEAIQHYEEDQEHSVLNLWYDPDVDLPEDLTALRRELKAVEVADVLAMAIRFDDLVIDLYKVMQENAPTEEVRDLFDNIARHEHREKLAMARSAGRLEDL